MISLATALYASTCPPEGWEKADGNGGWTPAVWPPTASTYCISPYGWQGTEETNHCAGGTNALDGCCEFIGGSERLRCEPCTVPPAPTVCTGNAAIDEVLWRSELWCKIGLSDANSVYTWEGFCEAVRHFNEIDGDRVLNLGEGAGSPAAARDTGLANVAALLAQCMWESGGDQPFSSCDENDYRGWVDSACTQRGGKERYDALTDQPWACTVPRPGTEVDKTMRMKAVTAVLANPPLECVPGTVTEGCCWWGRGAIQTTGPNNYGLLQDEIVSQIPALAGVDLCKNPEAMCCDGRAECGGIEHREMRWLGAIFYWANNVQGHGWALQKGRFDESLRRFVDGGFDRAASVVDGADFAQGTGSLVNNGVWGTGAHGAQERLDNFDFIVSTLRAAGMGGGAPTDAEEQNEVTPPDAEEQNAVTPPDAEEQNEVTPPDAEEQNEVTPPDAEEQNAVTPPAAEEQNAVTPPDAVDPPAGGCDTGGTPEFALVGGEVPPCSGLAEPWGQCDGRNSDGSWYGRVCCPAGHACCSSGEWWSACEPVNDLGTVPEETAPEETAPEETAPEEAAPELVACPPCPSSPARRMLFATMPETRSMYSACPPCPETDCSAAPDTWSAKKCAKKCANAKAEMCTSEKKKGRKCRKKCKTTCACGEQGS